eukprot:CAMPEP_0184351248 /NCGR_PEP_ID=MMETSP1089-20130417/43501_1 /TAXON_ID=38269 ORGANISM="Gloeochaete wittrockiana, Strain SAG46.84" /NCGR_SAMPLE_ID=MMETSP1089 /ASSEMBLY_ACC=CAM_ASM_000445 /LENGTH=782 /DNA_ID=CAMNT_0026684549 /DNA_START=81 /DNA_END=2429 /DNA_ORIENTATION=+
MKYLFLVALVLLVALPATKVGATEATDGAPVLEQDLKGAKVPLKTDTETFEREAEAMSASGYSLAEKRILEGQGEKHQFQAEVSRLLHMIINSLYSRRDIFLRELVSNASDALDKIRYLSLTGQADLGDNQELRIQIKADPDAKLLHIIDTGVGMTKQELITNLGTIAKSGTSEFISKLSETKDVNLIGQFGVGFYSAFLVADRVTVTSKSNDDVQWVWSSEADGNFSLTEDPNGNTLGRGTQVTLHLRDDAPEFLQQDTLSSLIDTHSAFINYPIFLWASHDVETPVPQSDDSDNAAQDDEDLKIEDADEEEDQEDQEEEDEEEKNVKETVWEWKLLNDVKPLWVRDSKEISDDEYKAFFKSTFDETDDPLSWTHFSAEGDLEFRSILYIPSHLDSSIFDSKNTQVARGLKLFVKRVFITDDFDLLIPKYLAFIKGIVDAQNLPLNVSREILQQSKILKSIEKKLVRKILSMIQTLAQDDKEKYDEFYDEFRVNLKLGMLDDAANRERISKLLRFYSSTSSGDLRSFDDYVSSMKEGQDKIYFIAGESKQVVASSPLLEKLNDKGYEVLYFVDPIDEYWVSHLPTFDGKRLVNVAKDGDLGIETEEEKEKSEEDLKQLEDLNKFFKNVLGNKISKSTVSKRLTTTPSALVSATYGYTANMERIIKSQALNAGQPQSFIAPRKVLEINPDHPIIKELSRRVQADEEDPIAKDIAEIVYDTAALNSGFSLDDLPAFASRIHRMVSLGLNIPLSDDSLSSKDQEVLEKEDEVADDHSSHSHSEL